MPRFGTADDTVDDGLIVKNLRRRHRRAAALLDSVQEGADLLVEEGNTLLFVLRNDDSRMEYLVGDYNGDILQSDERLVIL